MDLKYVLYGIEVKENKQSIGTGETVKMSIMSVEDRIWQQAELLLYEGETEDAFPVELLGPYGNPHDAGKYYVKVIKKLPSLLDD